MTQPAPPGLMRNSAKTERPPGIVGPDGLADVVPTTTGRFPPSAESLCTPPDRFGQFSKWRHVFISIAPGQAAEASPAGSGRDRGSSRLRPGKGADCDAIETPKQRVRAFPFQTCCGTRLSVPRPSLRSIRANEHAWEDVMVDATQYRTMAAEHHRLAGMCRSPESREEHFRLEKEFLALADCMERSQGVGRVEHASDPRVVR
jgi:hypothetical protein